MRTRTVKQTGIQLLLIVTVSVIVLFVSLGKASLWDRDEPRNAGCAAEMMARGDWVVPIFNDEIRHQKPVLLYWVMMASYSLFGINEFGARFGSALLAIGSVLATYFIGRRLAHPHVGLLASIILATSLMFDVAGRAATPDSVLIFCSTLAILFYVWGTFAPKEKPADPPKLRTEGIWFPQSYPFVVAMYAAMGLAVLAKGPVGLVVPTAILGMFLLIKRLPPRREASVQQNGRIGNGLIQMARPFHPKHFLQTCWSMRPITAIGVAFLVAAPWYVWVGLRTEGDFLKMFFFTENFGRATTAFENHSGGFWYYPLTLALGFFPWSVFAVPMLIGADRRIGRRDAWASIDVFCLCWIGVQVGIFSIVQTKLPSYVTPCYPALAILAASGLYRIANQASLVPAFWIKASFVSLALSGLAIGGGLLFAATKFFPGESWLGAIGLIPLIGGTACFWFFVHGKPATSVFTSCLTATLFAVCFFGVATVRISSHQQSQVVLSPIAELPESTKVATYRCLESSWVYYAKRPIFELSTAPANSLDPAGMEREKRWRAKPRLTPEQFVGSNPDAVFVTTAEHVEELSARLPSDYEIVASTDYFLRDRKLLLLAPAGRGERTANSFAAPKLK